MEIQVKKEARCTLSSRRVKWADDKPYIVLVNGVAATDKLGRVRRFETRENARKAFA